MAEKPRVDGTESIAEKLDKDLDLHLQSVLEKNKNFKYEDGFSKENFDEQVKLIPAFCNDAPTQEEIDKSPALQALQALKYEEENPHECATSHKEDGNYHFQRKDYKTAIKAYTEGLKQKHEDSMLSAVLYTNRAAAHFHLGNNRSALNDATWALKSKPDHMKAIVRAAICCFDLEKYDDCISWCDRGLKVDSTDKKLLELRKKCAHQKKQQDRDRRKQEMKQIKDLTAQKELINAINSRNIVLEQTNSELDKLQKLLMNNNAPHAGKIYLDEKKVIHWPVYLLYPEFNQSDFVEDFSEDHRFEDQLCVVLDVIPDWDVEKSYTMQNIQIFFEDRSRSLLVRVSSHATLKRVLTDKRYIVRGGCPAFIILSNKTNFYQQTLEKQQVEDF